MKATRAVMVTLALCFAAPAGATDTEQSSSSPASDAAPAAEAAKPDASSPAAEDPYGAMPTRHEELIKAFFDTYLKDPFTAQYRFSSPQKGAYVTTTTHAPGLKGLFGISGKVTTETYKAWQCTVLVNAKNSYGAYIGWKKYDFFFKGDDLLKMIED